MGKKKYAVFTMDVEAFSHTECVANAPEAAAVDLMDGFDEYIRILDKHQIKSTLFTVGSLAPEIADRLRASIRNGHRLALHGHEHIAPMDVSEEDFRTENARAKETLQRLFDTEIQGFRAPFFSMDDRRLAILKELGFKYDSSHLGFAKARHTVRLELTGFKEVTKDIFRRGDFFEFGLSKQKVFGCSYPVSGGGYVRLSNWFFVKNLIRRHLRENSYYVFYLHPFELTSQPVPVPKNLKGYDQYYLQCGIHTYGAHIEQIIRMLKKQGYSFVTFEELSQTMARKETA